MCTAGHARLPAATAPISGYESSRYRSGRGRDPLTRGITSLPPPLGVTASGGPLPARAALQAKYTAKGIRHVWKRPDQQQQQQQQVGRSVLINHPAQPQGHPLQASQAALKPAPFLAVLALAPRANLKNLPPMVQPVQPIPSKANTWVLGKSLGLRNQHPLHDASVGAQPHLAPQERHTTASAAATPQTRLTANSQPESKSKHSHPVHRHPESCKHQSLTWTNQLPRALHSSGSSVPGGPVTAHNLPPAAHIPAVTHAPPRHSPQMQQPLTTRPPPGQAPAGKVSATQQAAGYVKRSANKLHLVHTHAPKPGFVYARATNPGLVHPHAKPGLAATRPPAGDTRKHSGSSRGSRKPAHPAVKPNVWQRVEKAVGPHSFKLRSQHSAVLSKLRKPLSTPAHPRKVSISGW